MTIIDPQDLVVCFFHFMDDFPPFSPRLADKYFEGNFRDDFLPLLTTELVSVKSQIPTNAFEWLVFALCCAVDAWFPCSVL